MVAVLDVGGSRYGGRMSTQHTPGPWEAREWTTRGVTTVGRVCDNLLGFEMIADCAGIGRQVTGEQEEADARLISAAPELLATLRALVDACYAADVAGNLAGEVDGSLLDSALAAIAKATGPASSPDECPKCGSDEWDYVYEAGRVSASYKRCAHCDSEWSAA